MVKINLKLDKGSWLKKHPKNDKENFFYCSQCLFTWLALNVLGGVFCLSELCSVSREWQCIHSDRQVEAETTEEIETQLDTQSCMRRSTLARARWTCTHSQTVHTTRKWHRQSVTQMLLMSTYSHLREVEPLSWCRAVLNFKGLLRNSNQNSHAGMGPHTHSHEKVTLLPCPRGASQLPSAYLLYCGGLLKMFQSNGHLKVNQKCSVTAMFVWSYVTYCHFPQTNFHLNIWRKVRWHLWSLTQKTQRCFNTSIF